MTKSLLFSKTAWVNAIISGMALTDTLPVDGTNESNLIVLAVCAVNVVLRLITKSRIRIGG